MYNDAWNDAVRAPIEPTNNDTEYYATEKRKWELMMHPEKQRGNQNGKPGTTPRFKQTTKKNATKTNLFGYWSKNGTIEYAPNSRNQMTVIVQLVKFFREKKLANGFFNKKISSGNQKSHTGRWPDHTPLNTAKRQLNITLAEKHNNNEQAARQHCTIQNAIIQMARNDKTNDNANN